jgi:hypothetical protein
LFLPPHKVLADATGASPAAPTATDAVGLLRAARRTVSAAQAEELRCVARLAAECRREAKERCSGAAAGGDSDSRHAPDVDELAETLAVDAVSCALGIGRSAAADLVDLSERLTTVLPEVLDAWGAGVLDAGRARVLVRATEVLDPDASRRVADELLDGCGDGPWEGPSPRAWRTRVERAVVRADRAAAARRRAAALAARRVRAWAESDGMGVLQLRADADDVALADEVISDLARSWPSASPDGEPLSMDQRRVDAFMSLMRGVRDGSLTEYPDSIADDGSTCGQAEAGGTLASASDPPAGVRLPRVPVRRVHDLGLVLHADTLFGDGPAAEETAERRGLGEPGVMDPLSARRLARRHLRNKSAVQVLVVDRTGALARVVRFDRHAASHVCRSRESLAAAVRGALPGSPPLSTTGYTPTEGIARHVRAEAPTCSFYDCGRRARESDIDHDTPWPRGPTCVTNLDPKCRRHHNLKTYGLLTTWLRAGPGKGARAVHWTAPGGLSITTHPAPLPGCGR